MKTIVCIKQVPSREALLRVNEDSSWVRESDLSYEMNEPDAYALEAALQMKERQGGEVVVLSMGPARVQQVIREALAKGADRGIHLEDSASARLDAIAGARAMAEVIREEGFDLVATGLQSDDMGLGQTGVVLAALLGIPHATIIMEIQAEAGGLKLKRELEGGWFQWVEMPLPALLTIQSGISKLRYATLMGIKKAKSKELRSVAAPRRDDAPNQKLHKVYVPVKQKRTEFLEGGPKEIAEKLAQRLVHSAH
jgi:electron transfer flavoprotein beta subunit